MVKDAIESEKERISRIRQKFKVLFFMFLLNVLVCSLKAFVGLSTGLLNLVADAIHSFFDSLSNVVGMFGLFFAKKSPDEKFPYGYAKFETVATLIVASLIGIAFYKVLEGAYDRFMNPRDISFGFLPFAVLLFTMAINMFIARYERKKGEELRSELLVADAAETKSDIWVSASVICGLALIKWGGNFFDTRWALLDPLISVGIALLILLTFIENIKMALKILCDASVVPESEVKEFVLGIPGVKFCHAIRSRGRADTFFLELHIGVLPGMSVKEAHNDVSHRVKLALREKYPDLECASIQIEPDDENGRSRANSVFKERDHQ